MKKHRTKWASAEHKRLAQELDTEWQNRLRSFARLSPNVPVKKTLTMRYQAPKIPPGRATTSAIPSIDMRHLGAVASKPVQTYTGDKVLGIAVQHKSCLQPIFSQESAVDSAHMRR